MEFLAALLARLLGAALSWLDASNLRNRVYEQREQLELCLVALEDIERMTDDPRIKEIIRLTKRSVL